jgi:protease YdgD
LRQIFEGECMRVRLLLLAAAALAAAAPTSMEAGAADETRARLSNAELSLFLHQARNKPAKPGAISPRGDDTCQWAHDRECDEPDLGTGACRSGTDYSDCRFLREGETDDCQWARDNECDEPGLGTGACTQGTDRTDCAGIVALRFQTDSCDHAFNGLCEERGSAARNGPAQCEPRSDRADCIGRQRPMTIYDHFQGRDDRVLLDTSAAPWSAVGVLEFESGSECTGTLVARDVVLSAAHCVHDDDNNVAAAGVFRSGFGRRGGAQEARITGYLVAPRFNVSLFNDSDKLDGTDWVYLRLDRPLGDTLGTIAIRPLTTVSGITLDQAGYSWDTEGHLSGHLGCAAVGLSADGTLEHTCDTTRGDSGSPLMVVRDGVHGVVAVDSNFRNKAEGPVVNIAARSLGFEPYLADFAAGRVGTDITTRAKVKTQ